ncbi:MAG: ankyrin repeat domain-containing protein [Alphaproteobacteria bacterium]|nr:MAG: ankyrin repeat domain-containing protein [Alphaproteobacteria bacterium]
MGRNDGTFNKVSATPQELGAMLIKLIKTPKDGASGNITLVERCRELLDDGADLETRDGKGMTPLIWASANFRAKILQLLIDHGADAYAVDNDGLSAIDHAQRRKQKPALLMLKTAQMVQLYKNLEHFELQKPVAVKKPLKLKTSSSKEPA